MKKILLSFLMLGLVVTPSFGAATLSDSVKEPHPEQMSYVDTGFPIGTIMSFSQKIGDAENKGYLLCDGSTFSASKYSSLAKALMVCTECGNSLGGSTYCKYCKKVVKWKYAYNDDSNPQGTPKLPDMGGKFLRGFNKGTGYVQDGDPLYGLYSMETGLEGVYRTTHISGNMGATQYSSARGHSVTGSDDGNMSFITMLPLDEDGNKLAYATNDLNVNGNTEVDFNKTEYIQAESMAKAGNILQGIASVGMWFIPGLFQKNKTYDIATPVKYKINADIGNASTDTTGDYARPVNNATYYYIRAW